MCWYRRIFSRFRATPFAREVHRLFFEYNLYVFGAIGHIMSAMVFIDMLQKLSGGSDTSWSPLRVLGTPIWLPLTNSTGKLLAAQTLVHSVMYFVACYYLLECRYQKNVTLLAPWIAMHCFFMVYQIIYVLENQQEYEVWETIFAITDFPVLNIVLVYIATHTAMKWMPAVPPRRRRAGVPVSSELEPLYAHMRDEDLEEVTDVRWSLPPPPSYAVSMSSPSHAIGDTPSQIPENQGGAIEVEWPWRWRAFREAAMAAAAAANEAVELQAFGSADELEAEAPAGEEQPAARPTGWWLGRWRWGTHLDPAVVASAAAAVAAAAEPEDPSAGQHQQMAPRRRAVAAQETAADEPLLQHTL